MKFRSVFNNFGTTALGLIMSIIGFVGLLLCTVASIMIVSVITILSGLFLIGADMGARK